MWKKTKKSQVVIYGIMLGLVIIILAMALAPAVRDSTEGARNVTEGDRVGLNCSTTDSSFIKATCLATDMTLFYFIGGLIFIGGIVLVSKIVFE